VEGAQTVRIFGEEIAVQAHIHTLGGFSAHADQKGLLDWLSHFNNPNLEVFVVHGEETVASALGQRIRERFHFKTTVPQWKESRFLWGPEERGLPEKAAPEKRREEFIHPLETLPNLLRDLDRSYKRLRRKLKAERWEGRISPEPPWLKGLEEIHAKIEELESGLK
jgi:metallo-beta-lactamase family protein